MVISPLDSLTLTGGGRRKDRYQYIFVQVTMESKVGDGTLYHVSRRQQLIENFEKWAPQLTHLLTEISVQTGESLILHLS